MLIVGINGSPNRNGNTKDMLELLKKETESLGAQFEIIHAQEAILDCKTPFCVNCSAPCSGKCMEGSKLEKAYEKMSQADAIVLASPVYFGTVSAQLKAFFDKSSSLRREHKLLGKIGAGMTVGASKYGGQETTLMTINNLLLMHGVNLVNDASVGLSAGHFGVCAQKPAKEDENASKGIHVLAHRLVEEIKRKK